MGKLGEKLSCELKSSGQVIACRFALPGVEPAQTVDEGMDTVWMYTAKSLKTNAR